MANRQVKLKMELSATAKKRLRLLAKLLRADARRKNGIKFDMGTFGDFKTPEPTMDCGTRACAFGLAAISGKFKRVGLDYEVKPRERFMGDVENYRMIFTYKGDSFGQNDMEVASHVFDIPESLAGWLFGGQASRIKRGAKAEIQMAEIIEKTVKGDLPEDIKADLFNEFES